MAIKIFNKTNEHLKVEIPLGQIFEPADSTIQNMILTQQLFVQIAPQYSNTSDIYAMCIQQYDAGTSQDAIFFAKAVNKGHLLGMAELLQKYNVQDNLGQNAIWVISDNIPLSEINDEHI